MCSTSTFDNVGDLLLQFSKSKNKKNTNVKTEEERICSECHNDSLLNDKGVVYCTTCGVICDMIIDQSPEWRYYGGEITWFKMVSQNLI